MALVAVVAVVAVLIFGPACVWGQQLLGNTEDPRSCRALLQNRARWLPGGSYLDCSLPGVSYIDCRSLGSYFDCSLAKSAQGTSEAKVLGCTRASEPMHLGPANLTPASAQDNANSVSTSANHRPSGAQTFCFHNGVLMQLSSELHQHLPEAASEATTLPLLELACRHPIQVSLLCLKGQFVSLSILQKLPAKMTWAQTFCFQYPAPQRNQVNAVISQAQIEHSNKEIHSACKCFHGASRRGAEWGTLEPGLVRNVNHLNVLQKKWLLIRTKLRLDKCAVLWAVCNAVCSAVLTACPHVVR